VTRNGCRKAPYLLGFLLTLPKDAEAAWPLPADPLCQHLLLTAENKFWRCVSFGEPPRLFGVEPPRPRIESVAGFVE
jgi:hypothetical protein